MKLPDLHRSRCQRGFTLVEIITVITILALIMSTAAVGITNTLQSQRLSTTACRFAAEFSAASLQAVRENRRIQLRLLRQPSEFGSDNYNHLRAVQWHAIDPVTGESSPLSEPLTFDTGVVILENPTYSTLLTHKSSSLPDGYCTLKPAGGTDLSKDTADRWCLTLVLQKDLKDANFLPADHRTLVINPFTCAVQAY